MIEISKTIRWGDLKKSLEASEVTDDTVINYTEIHHTKEAGKVLVFEKYLMWRSLGEMTTKEAAARTEGCEVWSPE